MHRVFSLDCFKDGPDKLHHLHSYLIHAHGHNDPSNPNHKPINS